jgi:hypothetical protein
MLIGSISTRQNSYISDNFNTDSNPISQTSSGHLWNIVSGSISSSGGNGIFTPASPTTDYSYAMSYIATPYAGLEIIAKDITNNTGIAYNITPNNLGFYFVQKCTTPNQDIILFGGRNISGQWSHPAQLIATTSYGTEQRVNTIKIKVSRSTPSVITYWLYQDSAMTSLINSVDGTTKNLSTYMPFSLSTSNKHGLICFKNTSYYTFSTPGFNIGDFSLTSTPG